MLIVYPGVPCIGIHVCHCRWRNNDLSPWYHPISDIHVNPIWYPDDIEVHPETESLGVDSLKNWQAKQLFGVKSDVVVCILECTGINLFPHPS